MRNLIFAIITILLIVGLMYFLFAPRQAHAYCDDSITKCTECDDCAIVYEWTTEGIPSPTQLNSLLHQLLPVVEDIDCMTIQNAEGTCTRLDNPMEFLQFNYSDFASSICEKTSLTFYDCDGSSNSVPIPGTGLLLMSGILGLTFIRRKRDV
jgi:hypothetical protein